MAKKSVQKAKNTKPFIGILVAIGLVGVAAIGYLATRSADAEIMRIDTSVP
ncbi:MAG: hypothetical protein HYR75_04025, partial [Gemmatimonadetes bacterium]|nr:hypothetical protein [Gemmatimonadota bacterium]